MEVIEKIKPTDKLGKILKTSPANQNINEQIADLEVQKKVVEQRLLIYLDEPMRRPSKGHKLLNQELQSINKTIRKLTKTLKKINSIKEITAGLGYQHGKVMLNKTKYYW